MVFLFLVGMITHFCGVSPQLLKRENINLLEWATCLNTAVHAPITMQAWYLDAVCVEGWEALVWREGTGQYQAIMPLPIAKRLGVQYLYQPLFTQYLGIAWRFGLDEDQLWHQAHPILKRRFPFGYFALHLGHIPSALFWAKRGASIKHRVTHHLDLSLPWDTLWMGYNKTARKHVRRLSNAEVKPLSDTDEIISVFRAHKTLKDVKSSDYERLSQLMKAALANNAGLALKVVSNTDHIGCYGFFLVNHRSIIYLFSAINEHGREINAQALMLTHVFQKYAGTGMKFDFEGSSIPAIATFNKSFGAYEVFYPLVKYNYASWPLSMLAP